MPAIRVERTAVQPYFLGLFGFDHLQLVYEPRCCGWSIQDDWYVIEGVRDPGPNGPILGVQGSDGRLTLAQANAASGAHLIAKIGTPYQRDSTVIASGRSAVELWPHFASHGSEIQQQRLPYVAFAPSGSPRPTRNSSSVIATLLHRLGFEVPACLPATTRRVPGIRTVIDHSQGRTGHCALA